VGSGVRWAEVCAQRTRLVQAWSQSGGQRQAVTPTYVGRGREGGGAGRLTGEDVGPGEKKRKKMGSY